VLLTMKLCWLPGLCQSLWQGWLLAALPLLTLLMLHKLCRALKRLNMWMATLR
jgi:hypothetical protein